jgi:hypothetical protein
VNASSPATTQPLLTEIVADILEIQHAIALTKLKQANSRLMLGVRTLALEDSLQQSDSILKKRKADLELAYHTVFKVEQTAPGDYGPRWPQAGYEAEKAGQEVGKIEVVNFGKRQALQLNELRERIAIASLDVEAARREVKVLDATRKLGMINCAKSCLVVRHLVMSGQYVNKGDPLVEVRVTTERGR